jgi:hypothetical protein
MVVMGYKKSRQVLLHCVLLLNTTCRGHAGCLLEWTKQERKEKVYLQVIDALLEIFLQLSGGHEVVQIGTRLLGGDGFRLFGGCALLCLNECCLLLLQVVRPCLMKQLVAQLNIPGIS